MPERELCLPTGDVCLQQDKKPHSHLPRRSVPRPWCRGRSGAGAIACTRGVGGAGPERVLSFFHTHTGERLKVAYCCGGEYQPAGLAEVNHILRDFRINESRPIEPGLLDLLHELGGTLHTDQPFHVISGYRSPETNRMLRERGGASTGVASHSLHMVGQAIDIRVPGVKLATLTGRRPCVEDRRRWLLSRSRFRARRCRSRPVLVADRPSSRDRVSSRRGCG